MCWETKNWCLIYVLFLSLTVFTALIQQQKNSVILNHVLCSAVNLTRKKKKSFSKGIREITEKTTQ